MEVQASPAESAKTSEPEELRIGLVHEWLAGRSGSEKTFEQMAAEFPEADLYALTHDEKSGLRFPSPVRTTVLQRSQALSSRRNLSLPLMPLAWRSLRIGVEYDVVVTSSHAFSRYFPARDAVHLSYVYTPLRYAWMPGVDGRGSSPLLGGPRAALRALDRRSTNGVTSFAAISTEVQRRIREFYDRDATVIFPSVDVGYFSDASVANGIDEPSGYVLGVSRWIRYKRLDLVIEAAERLDLPVVIAGHGPLEAELLAQARDASVPVRLVKSPSDSELRTLYRNAAAVVFPAEEDFGIVPVEAQASGTPVVALAVGGSLDTVADGVTGILVPEQTAETLADGLGRAIQLGRIDASDHLEQFTPHAFRTAFRRWVREHSREGN